MNKIELLMIENKLLREEIIKLKARLYDLEHQTDDKYFSGIDWSVFDMTMEGDDENRGGNELVDGFRVESGH